MSVGQVVEIDLVNEKGVRRLEDEPVTAESTETPVAEASTEPVASSEQAPATNTTAPKISAGMNLGKDAPIV